MVGLQGLLYIFHEITGVSKMIPNLPSASVKPCEVASYNPPWIIFFFPATIKKKKTLKWIQQLFKLYKCLIESQNKQVSEFHKFGQWLLSFGIWQQSFIFFFFSFFCVQVSAICCCLECRNKVTLYQPGDPVILWFQAWISYQPMARSLTLLVC